MFQTKLQIIFIFICSLITVFSGFSIFKSGNVYNDEDINKCKDFYFSVAYTFFIYLLCSIYGICYFLWKIFFICSCFDKINKNSFIILRILLFISTSIAILWEGVHFIKQDDKCYDIYKNNYTLLWSTMFIQILGIFLGIILFLIMVLIKIVKSNCFKQDITDDNIKKSSMVSVDITDDNNSSVASAILIISDDEFNDDILAYDYKEI